MQNTQTTKSSSSMWLTAPQKSGEQNFDPRRKSGNFLKDKRQEKESGRESFCSHVCWEEEREVAQTEGGVRCRKGREEEEERGNFLPME